MKPELSIIIVNYNGQKYLKDCFESIYRQIKNVSFEIIVVDNDSKDDSCNFIKTNYPEVRLFEINQNLGFGKGNNFGVKQAQGKFLLLLNNDTILLNDIGLILDYLTNNISVGAVGIKMLNAKKEYLPVAGNFPNISNMFQFKRLLRLGKEFESGNFEKEEYEVDWLGGSFLMMPKNVYEMIGGFDEDYFLYVEDVDFCKKISDAGFKRVFLPRYSYIHFVGFNKKKNPMLVEGYRMYIQKHFSGFQKYMLSAVLLINSVVKSLKLAFKTD